MAKGAVFLKLCKIVLIKPGVFSTENAALWRIQVYTQLYRRDLNPNAATPL